MRISARLLVSILFVVISFVSFSSPAFAQTYSPQQNSYTNLNTNPDVPQNFHSLTQVVTTEVLSSMICQLAGFDITGKNNQCLGIDAKTGRIGYIENGGGIIGLTIKGIAFTYQLPVHTGNYVGYVADNFGFANKSYAAVSDYKKNGVGFASLEPLLGLWTAVRNFIYLCFIVVFILIGIGVMLRIQIDPRTVMTIENTLPKIIVGLILITFSYAIAGILIDLMWVLTFFFVNTVVNAAPDKSFAGPATLNLLTNPIPYFDKIWNGGIFGLTGAGVNAITGYIWYLLSPSNYTQLNIANSSQGNCLSVTSGLDWNCVWSGLLGGFVAVLFTAVNWILGTLIILFAILIGLIRLWIVLVKAYINIILDVIFAPYYIALGVFPGSTYGINGWLRGMTANLLTFPVVVGLLLLARVVSDSLTHATNLFVPPLVGNPNSFGMLSGDLGVKANPLGTIFALGLIFITPAMLDTLRKAIQAPESNLGQVAMGGFTAGGRLLSRAAGTATSGFIDPTTGSMSGGFKPGRILSRLIR